MHKYVECDFLSKKVLCIFGMHRNTGSIEKLHGLELAVDISDGVIFAAQTEFTDVCMVLLLTAMTYFLVIYEKKNQLYRLLKSTYKGRKYVIRANC